MKNAISQEDKGDGRQQMRAGKLNSPLKNTCARLARRVLAVDFPIFSNKNIIRFNIYTIFFILTVCHQQKCYLIQSL